MKHLPLVLCFFSLAFVSVSCLDNCEGDPNAEPCEPYFSFTPKFKPNELTSGTEIHYDARIYEVKEEMKLAGCSCKDTVSRSETDLSQQNLSLTYSVCKIVGTDITVENESIQSGESIRVAYEKDSFHLIRSSYEDELGRKHGNTQVFPPTVSREETRELAKKCQQVDAGFIVN